MNWSMLLSWGPISCIKNSAVAKLAGAGSFTSPSLSLWWFKRCAVSSRKRRVRLKLGVIESERYEACKFSFAQLGSWPGCRRVNSGRNQWWKYAFFCGYIYVIHFCYGCARRVAILMRRGAPDVDWYSLWMFRERAREEAMAAASALAPAPL